MHTHGRGQGNVRMPPEPCRALVMSTWQMGKLRLKKASHENTEWHRQVRRGAPTLVTQCFFRCGIKERPTWQPSPCPSFGALPQGESDACISLSVVWLLPWVGGFSSRKALPARATGARQGAQPWRGTQEPLRRLVSVAADEDKQQVCTSHPLQRATHCPPPRSSE